ncbi:hypothetical protein D3C79_1066100 [compost metagenome]
MERRDPTDSSIGYEHADNCFSGIGSGLISFVSFVFPQVVYSEMAYELVSRSGLSV